MTKGDKWTKERKAITFYDLLVEKQEGNLISTHWVTCLAHDESEAKRMIEGLLKEKRFKNQNLIYRIIYLKKVIKRDNPKRYEKLREKRNLDYYFKCRRLTQERYDKY